MAAAVKNMPRGAFHTILRRNLRWLSSTCVHVRLLDAISPEELLLTATGAAFDAGAGAAAPVATDGAALRTAVLSALDRLDSAHMPTLEAALCQLSELVCLRANGCVRAGPCLRAASLIHALGGSATLLHASLRVLHAQLDGIVGGEQDGPRRVLNEALLLLHALLVANDGVPDFIALLRHTELHTGFALTTACIDLLCACTSMPASLCLPTRRVLLLMRECICLLLLPDTDGSMQPYAAHTPHPFAAASPAWVGVEGGDVEVSPRPMGISRRSSELQLASSGTASAAAATSASVHAAGGFMPTPALNGDVGAATAAAATARGTRSSSLTHAPAKSRSFVVMRGHAGAEEEPGAAETGSSSPRATPTHALPHVHEPPLPSARSDATRVRMSRAFYSALLSPRRGMPRWQGLIADILAVSLATAPNLKSYTGKIDIYAELGAYTGAAGTLPDALRSASRVRHRDILATVCAELLLLLLKTARVGHALHAEYVAALLESDNACLLILKYLAQDIGDFISMADGTAVGVCDGSEAYLAASKQAAVALLRRNTGRRRSATSTGLSLSSGAPTSHTTSSGTPPVSTTLLPPTASGATFTRHGLMDIKPALDAAAAHVPRRGSLFASASMPNPAESTLPDGPSSAPSGGGRLSIGLIGRSSSSPSTPLHALTTSLSDDILREARSPVASSSRRGSPTSLARPSLDMQIVPTIAGDESSAATGEGIRTFDEAPARSLGDESVAALTLADATAQAHAHDHADASVVLAAAVGLHVSMLHRPRTASVRRSYADSASVASSDVASDTDSIVSSRSRDSWSSSASSHIRTQSDGVAAHRGRGVGQLNLSAIAAAISSDAHFSATSDAASDVTGVSSPRAHEHVESAADAAATARRETAWWHGCSRTGWPWHSRVSGACVDAHSGEPHSRRRVQLIVCLLRVLRIVTKDHTERVKDQLVKYKSQLVFVKACGVECVPVVYYALKCLKLQVRHLGMWKRRNMAIVTAIYHYIPPRSQRDGDDGAWLQTPELLSTLRAINDAKAGLTDASGDVDGAPRRTRAWAGRIRGRGGGRGAPAASSPSVEEVKSPAHRPSLANVMAAVRVHNEVLASGKVPVSWFRTPLRAPTVPLQEVVDASTRDATAQLRALQQELDAAPAACEAEALAAGLHAGNVRAWLDIVLPTAS